MSFPPDFLQQLRDALPLSDVVGKRVPLTRKGREWGACCPFHKEKTPSFTVNDEKQFYHCFGCGAHGDIIGFMKDYEGLEFLEAVERLATQAGMQVPKSERQDPERKKQQQDGHALMQAAQDWFRAQLYGPKGRNAADYITERGLKAGIVELFGLGYAPDTRSSLKDTLLAKGFTEKQLITFGLVIPSDRGASYDRFRGRLIFPIHDRQGRVVAFGGRILGDGEPKYLNSPETPLFHKGNMLYAAHLARKAARDKGQVIAAEGYMDVIALHQAGFTHAVAPLGTAVTEAQLRACWSMAKEPVFCLDGDRAGMRAMQRVATLAVPLLQPGHFLRFALLPHGEDPDTLVRDAGKGAMEALLRDALPLSRMLWQQAQQEVLGNSRQLTPEKMATLENTAGQWAGRFTHPTLQRYMQDFVRQQCRELSREQASVEYKKRQSKGKPGHNAQRFHNHAGQEQKRTADFVHAARRTMHTNTNPAEALVLALIMHYPALLEDAGIEEQFATWHFTGPQEKRLQSELLHLHCAGDALSAEGLRVHLRQAGLADALTHIEKNPVVALSRFCREKQDLTEVRREWELMMQEMQRGHMRQERQQQALRLEEELSDQEWQRYLTTLSQE